LPLQKQKATSPKRKTEPSSPTQLKVWLCLLLVAINIAVYSPLRHYGFVNYDDPPYVTENPNVATGLTLQNIRWAATTGHNANWHPLTWLSHMLDVELFGMNAGWHHITSIVLHSMNTLLLFLLLCRLTGAIAASAFAASLFAVHPLHVQSVAWIAERKDVLSTLFWMLAWWGYVEYVRRPNLMRYLGTILLFAAGLAAKPMLVTFPFVLLLLDFWPLCRMRFSPNSEGKLLKAPLLKLIVEKVPFFILTIASSIVTFTVQQDWGAVAAGDLIPLSMRIANAPVSYVAYLFQTLVPVNLAVLYPFPVELPVWKTAGAVLLLAGISALAILKARQLPYLAVGWLWFLGTMVPTIGLIQVGIQARADRYTYIPQIGLILIVAWGTAALFSKGAKNQVGFTAVAAAVTAVCVVVSMGQVKFWSDSETLWQRALDVTENNYVAEYNLAESLTPQQSTRAIFHLREALRLKPDLAVAHKSLGVHLAQAGNREEGARHLAEALRINPNIAAAHNDLAILLAEQNKLDEAILHYSEALRLNPRLVVTYNNLGNALAAQGRWDEAIRNYSEALKFNPRMVEALANLGRALAAQGRVDEAIQQYSRALAINPNLPGVQRLLDELRR
jgi:Flp pilus assembly protein TadD